eukprot:scaffold35698_cov63-Attheya_sp.AAC.15
MASCNPYESKPSCGLWLFHCLWPFQFLQADQLQELLRLGRLWLPIIFSGEVGTAIGAVLKY